MQSPNLNMSFRSRGRKVAVFIKASKQLQPARFVLACLVLAVFGLVFTGSANAQCDKLTTPNATLTLGSQTTAVESRSNSGSYGGSGRATIPKNTIPCYYWVVDITVTANSSAEIQYYSRAIRIASGGDVPKTKTGCQLYRGDSLIYVKTSDATGFQLLQKRSSKGVWHTGNGLFPASCSVGESLSKPRNPPISGFVVYRVAASARLAGEHSTVVVKGWHPSQPQ